MFPLAAQSIAQQFAASNPDDCSIVNLNSNPVEIDCGVLGDSIAAGQYFEDLCNSFGGQFGAVDGNGDVIAPHYPNGPDN